MSTTNVSTDHVVNDNDTDQQSIVELDTIHHEDPPEQPGHQVNDTDTDQQSIVSLDTIHHEPHPRRIDPAGPTQSQRTTFGACFIFLILAVCFSEPLLTTSLPDFSLKVFTNTPYAQYRWAEQAWTITATAVGPLYGRLSYHYGRQQLMIFATLVFMVGQAFAVLSADRFYLMILMRAVAGVGGGGILPLAFISCADLFQDPKRRAQQTAPWALVYTISSLVVPYLGVAIGKINGGDWWQWLFYIPLILGFIGIAFACLLPRKLRTKNPNITIDWWGMLSLVFSIALLITAFAWSSYEGIDPKDPSSHTTTTSVASGLSILPTVSSNMLTTSSAQLQISTFSTATNSIGLVKRRWWWDGDDDDHDDCDDDDSSDNSTTSTSLNVSQTSQTISRITDTLSQPPTSTKSVSSFTSSLTMVSHTNIPVNLAAINWGNLSKAAAYSNLNACSVFIPSAVADPSSSVNGGTGVSHSGWIAILVILFALGSGSLALFGFIEDRDGNTSETIPLKVFKNWTLMVIFLIETLFGIVFSAIQHFLPIYFGSQTTDCRGGSASALNIIPPLVGAGLATVVFSHIMSRWPIHHIFSLVGSFLMLVGISIITGTTSNPTVDTHIADGIALFIASVAVIIVFQVLVLWAQYECELIIKEENKKQISEKKEADEKGVSSDSDSTSSSDDDKDGLLNIVTGLTQAFWQLGTALGYTLSNLVFASNLTHIFYENNLDPILAQQIASFRAIPDGQATDITVAAYGQSLKLVYMSLCLPTAILCFVTLLAYWIWLKYHPKHPKTNPDEARDILRDIF